MHFCPDCESYLITRIQNEDNANKLMSLNCNNCGYKKIIDISKEPEYKCVYQTNYKIKKLKIDQQNIKYLEKDPTLPHVNNIPCPNPQCPTNKQTATDSEILTGANIQKNVLYLKLNDSDLTFLYQCCNCKHTWTNK